MNNVEALDLAINALMKQRPDAADAIAALLILRLELLLGRK